MIDFQSRLKFAQRQTDSQKGEDFLGGMLKATTAAVELKQENKQLMATMIQKDNLLSDRLNKLAVVILKAFKAFPDRVTFPKLMQIFGKVEIQNPVEIKNLSDLEKYFKSLEKSLPPTQKFPNSFMVDNLFELEAYFKSLEKRIGDLAQAISAIPQPKINFPEIKFPKSDKVSPLDLKPVIEAISSLQDVIASQVPPEIVFPKTFDIGNFPPTYTPPAVTKIDINPLRGDVINTGVTVGTTPILLPPTNAPRRRSMVVFNNHATAVLYIGNQNVATSGVYIGLPVLAQTYSPTMDIGPQVNLYGISTVAVTAVVLEAEADYGTVATSVGNV